MSRQRWVVPILAVGCVLAGCTAVVRPAPAVAVVRPGPVVVEEEHYVMRAPPPPREEVIVAAPSPAHVWVQGRWAWRNGWAWLPGHWAVPPRARAHWVPGYWDSRPRGWVWIEGHWG